MGANHYVYVETRYFKFSYPKYLLSMDLQAWLLKVIMSM